MTTPDLLSLLTGNPARARVLRVLVFNESRLMTATEVGKRASIPTRDAEHELKLVASWGIAKKVKADVRVARPQTPKRSGVRKIAVKKTDDAPMWTVNIDFPFLRPLSAFIHEVSPMRHEKIVSALRRGGRLAAVILSGHFLGDPSRPADLIVAADAFNERRLEQAVRQLEPLFGREIRYAAFSPPEFRYRLTIQDRLLRDTLDFPHVVLLDKTRML